MVKKKKYLIFGIIAVVLVSIVGTLAWYTFGTRKSSLVLVLGNSDELLITLSPYELNISAAPVTNYTSMTDYVSVTATNSKTVQSGFNFYYDINSIDSALVSSLMKYAVTRSSTKNGTYTQVATGSFSSASNGQRMIIYEETIPATTTYYYKIFTYLDGTQANASSLQNKKIQTTLGAYVANGMYQFVEYLESTGTQYINTGFIPTPNTDMELDFKYLGSGTTSWVPICGERSSAGSATYLNFFINASNLKITPNYAGYDPGNSSGFDPITVGTRYKLKNIRNNFYLNDVLKDSTTNTLIAGNTPIYVFAIGNGSGVDTRQLYMQLYSFKIYDGGILSRYYLPAYRKSDGARGLYETINGVFYTNSGTGTFDIGSEV